MCKEQKKISFQIENKTYQKLLADAEKESITVSAYIRRLLIHTLEPERGNKVCQEKELSEK